MTATPSGTLFCPDCWPKFNPHSEPKRQCPVDSVEMTKRVIEDLIVIDICEVCGGTWFDKGELEVINKLSVDTGMRKGFFWGWLRHL
jgi:hypothetical protein